MRVYGQLLNFRRGAQFSLLLLSIAAVFSILFPTQRAWAASSPATTTTLAITSGGQTVSSVTGGQVITLTATVLSDGIPVTPGQVNFCDATYAYCIDNHLLGTAQLTASGTATIRFVAIAGGHSYVARFAGTNKFASSSSGNSELTVSGLPKTVIDIGSTISPENVYSISATVYGNGKFPPTGSISFLNTSDDNATLSSANLYGPTTGLTFYNSLSLPTGKNAMAVASGDFNQDGIPDMAVANIYGNNVTVLLGNGDGTFTAAPALTAGVHPIGLMVADFNSDGIPDLAVVDAGSTTKNSYLYTVSILLGKGDGTFTPLTASYQTSYPLLSVASADFNGDGIADLAVGSESSGKVDILAGNGDGTFQFVETLPVGTGTIYITTADFNSDGIPDLAISGGPGLFVYLGRGDGTFIAKTVAPTSDGRIVAADVNGDGKPDLVTGIAFSGITVFLNQGDGTFIAAPEVFFTHNVYNVFYQAVAVADFNNDGIPDLAAICNNGAGPNHLQVAFGKGGGAFEDFMLIAYPGTYPTDIIAADWNGDGVPDLAITDSNTGDVSTFLTANQTATAKAYGITVAAQTPYVVTAAYAGDKANAASESGTAVSLLPSPKVVISEKPNPVNENTFLTLSAVVTGSGPVPTGTVDFYDRGDLIGSCGTGVSGKAGCYLEIGGAFPAGEDVAVGKYLGDKNYAPAYSEPIHFTVRRVAPFINLAASANPAAAGQLFSLTALLSFYNPVSGKMFFQQGNTVLGEVSNWSYDALGYPAFSVNLKLNAGQYSIKAVYSGDPDNAPAASNEMDLVVSKAAQIITFPALPADVVYGSSPITLLATTPSGLPITYSVTGPAMVNGSTLTFTGAGAVAVTARQDGNSNYDPAKPVTQTIVVKKTS